MQLAPLVQAALGVLVASCASGAGASPTPSPPTEQPAQQPAGGGRIEWRLTGRPTALAMAQRDSFVLVITADNRGDRVADTERDALALNVNGEDSTSFALAFGNGARDGRWAALPPGASVSEERAGLQLFDAAGDYDLLLHRGERVVARARVHVSE